jgi:hypothetical protein
MKQIATANEQAIRAWDGLEAMSWPPAEEPA